MSYKKKILIIGFGEMGHAMQALLTPLNDLLIWNRSPIPSIKLTPLKLAVPQADIIIFTLPVNAHDTILQTITPFINKKTLCLGIAKGLNEKGEMVSEIFSRYIGNYAVIYGPMISEELCSEKMGFAQFSCSKKPSIPILTELFKPTKLYLKASSDLIGISWSAILKNVYALAFGMIDELDMGKNIQGFVTVLALQEIQAISKSLGGEKISAYGLAGLGDLITTGNSQDSHHHALGVQMAQDDFKGIKGEGTHTLLMIEKFQIFKYTEYPLFLTLYQIFQQETQAEQALKALCQSSLS